MIPIQNCHHRNVIRAQEYEQVALRPFKLAFHLRVVLLLSILFFLKIARKKPKRGKKTNLSLSMMKCINNKSYRIFPFESWRSWSPSGIQPPTSSGCLVLFVTFAPWLLFIYMCALYMMMMMMMMMKPRGKALKPEEEGFVEKKRKGAHFSPKRSKGAHFTPPILWEGVEDLRYTFECKITITMGTNMLH